MGKPLVNLRFGESELWYYKWFQGVKSATLRPLVSWLAARKVKPEVLSYFGLFMAVPFVFFFGFHPWIAFLFILLQLFFDGLDGELARTMKRDSLSGEMLDLFCDYVSFFVHVLTLLYFGLIDGFWTSIFLVSYVVAQAFVSFAILKKIKVFPVARPKLAVYAVLLYWLISGDNFFDPLLVFFSIYLLVTNLFLFIRIRWEL